MTHARSATLRHTGTGPFTKVANSDAAGYTRKVGALCADVFAAAG